MNENPEEAIGIITEHAREIIKGSYKNVDRIFSLADETLYPPAVAALAETVGMMTVKVEAREFALAQTIEELKAEKAQVEHLGKVRHQLVLILITVVTLMSAYTFIMGILTTGTVNLPGMTGSVNNIIVSGFEILSVILIIGIVIVNRIPWNGFGLTVDGWKRSVGESFLVSLGAIFLLAVFKLVMNHYKPGLFHETAIFSLQYFTISYLTYIVVAPLQEFIARGVVQGTLMRLIDGRHRTLLAITITSLLFASFHVHFSVLFAMAAFVTSWLWGWLYSRYQTLTGVSLSHFMIGNAAGLMGFWTFF